MLPTLLVDGFSFRPLTEAPDAPSTHLEQYAQFGGNRGYYRDGWKLVTNHVLFTPFDDAEWELYDVRTDPTELHNLADEEPGLLKELAEAWETAAYRSSRLTTLRSFAVEIEVLHASTAAGVLVAHGDHRIDLRVDWRPGFRVDVRVLLDGTEVGRLDDAWKLVGMAPFSGIDVGLNRGGPVHWGVYERHGSFPYTGRLGAATWVPGEQAAYDPEQVVQAELEAALSDD